MMINIWLKKKLKNICKIFFLKNCKRKGALKRERLIFFYFKLFSDFFFQNFA